MVRDHTMPPLSAENASVKNTALPYDMDSELKGNSIVPPGIALYSSAGLNMVMVKAPLGGLLKKRRQDKLSQCSNETVM
ncbi:hypothetical protein EV361DRAFT_964854 [Lentinula raphanica]|nr:hypothetical protein EV361DRAFT_964854 [Lentinula raphanica]